MTHPTMAHDDTTDEGDEVALIRAAAAGDRQAAGAYFARHLPRLSSIAKGVAGNSHDHGDLLGEAILVVLSRWAEGTGPTDRVNGYITQIMRNRMKDDFRSPRSQVRYFDDHEDPVAQEDPRLRRAEIDAERALIRRALAELPDDQQYVLTATIVDGMRSQELRERLDRPMPAIYSLTHRAKANLRRAALRLMLDDDAPPECHRAAQHLPPHVGDSPDDVRGSRFTEHYAGCRRCRRIWARFAAMATLGLGPLLIVGDLLGDAPAATAADTGSSSSADAVRPRPGTARSTGGAVRATRSTRAAIGAAIAACVAGGAILVLLTVALVTQTLWFTPTPTASLDVRAETPSVSLTRLTVDFEVFGSSWVVRSARLVVSEPVDVVEHPDGWTCTSTGRTITCTTDDADARGGRIALAHSPSLRTLDYELTVIAVTDDGATVTGTFEDSVAR